MYVRGEDDWRKVSSLSRTMGWFFFLRDFSGGSQAEDVKICLEWIRLLDMDK